MHREISLYQDLCMCVCEIAIILMDSFLLRVTENSLQSPIHSTQLMMTISMMKKRCRLCSWWLGFLIQCQDYDVVDIDNNNNIDEDVNDDAGAAADDDVDEIECMFASESSLREWFYNWKAYWKCFSEKKKQTKKNSCTPKEEQNVMGIESDIFMFLFFRFSSVVFFLSTISVGGKIIDQLKH